MLDNHTTVNKYSEIIPPYLVKATSLLGSGNLPKFGDNIYHDTEDDLWLIPTAEVPLTNLHRDDVLSENGILGLVSDQDAKTKGVFVNFFGSPASTPKGAAIFHIKTSAPMMIGTCIKKAFMHYEIRFCSIDTSSQNLTDITQNYTTILENHIRKNPEQYFWFHRRWKTRP